jgi:hypothetical protein
MFAAAREFFSSLLGQRRRHLGAPDRRFAAWRWVELATTDARAGNGSRDLPRVRGAHRGHAVRLPLSYAGVFLGSSFVVCAGTFALTSLFAFSKKRDLTTPGSLAIWRCSD